MTDQLVDSDPWREPAQRAGIVDGSVHDNRRCRIETVWSVEGGRQGPRQTASQSLGRPTVAGMGVSNMHIHIAAALVVVWLVIGAIAAGQRHYYSTGSTNCAHAGTIAVTVLSGPLNYFGVNPEVANCRVPQPSH